MRRIAIGRGILMLLAAFLAAAPAARADWVVLRNGQRMHVSGYERRGNQIILHLAGGQATLPASDVLRIEPEDVFPAALPARSPSALFGKLIAKAAKKHGLDRKLLRSVVHAESNFHPHAVSRRGALGLMQLMPKTARKLAVRNPLDPSQNVDGGARYLKQLMRQFGSLNLALAAYNAGPARVELYHGVPPFPETRAYIARVRRGMRQPAARAKKRNATTAVKVVCSPTKARCREEAAGKAGR